jgi:hypothetical protein
VLNSQDAVEAFAKGGNVTIGGALAAAAGPIGVGGAVNTAILKPAPMFTYSKSKGLFAGVSLEGTILIERVSLGCGRCFARGVGLLKVVERDGGRRGSDRAVTEKERDGKYGVDLGGRRRWEGRRSDG